MLETTGGDGGEQNWSHLPDESKNIKPANGWKIALATVY